MTVLTREATHPPVTDSTRPAIRRLAAVAPALVIATVIITLAAGLGVTVLKLRRQDFVNSLRSSALTAATTDAVYASSYDYHNLTGKGSAWSKLEANSTAKFRKDFVSTSGGLGKLLTQYNATAQGKVSAAGISTISASRAVVLLFVDQTVTNTVQKPKSATQPLRVEVTLLREHGKWLIDNLTVPT